MKTSLILDDWVFEEAKKEFNKTAEKSGLILVPSSYWSAPIVSTTCMERF